jgi:hypothetical protein
VWVDERVQLRRNGELIMRTLDRRDGVLDCTRFRQRGKCVTAQQLEKRVVRNDVREFLKGQEREAGRIFPLNFGVAAYLWLGSDSVKLGEFDNEQEAFEAICNKFNFANCRRMLHRA